MKKKFVEDREYELNLIIQAKKGDAENSKEAMGELLEYHFNLIYKLAGKLFFLFPTETYEDVVNEFSIFFIRCVEKFDPDNKSGASLSTYFHNAVYFNVWKLHNQRRSLVRVPNHVCQEAAKILKIRKDMLKKIGEKATDEIIYAKIGISKELGDFLLSSFNSHSVSFNSPINQDSEWTYADFIASQKDEESDNLDRIFRQEASKRIKSVLAEAHPTIRVFVEKFLSGIPTEEIMNDLRLSLDELDRIWRMLRIQLGQDSQIREIMKSMGIA